MKKVLVVSVMWIVMGLLCSSFLTIPSLVIASSWGLPQWYAPIIATGVFLLFRAAVGSVSLISRKVAKPRRIEL